MSGPTKTLPLERFDHTRHGTDRRTTVSAESDGYRFVGYFVTWHNQRVFVVDPDELDRATGETINPESCAPVLARTRGCPFP